MQNHYAAQTLIDFSSALFEASGLAPDRAQVLTRVFLEADLLGFTTHGLNRVSHNLRWIEETDPVQQTLLELYAAIRLASPHNDFDTH